MCWPIDFLYSEKRLASSLQLRQTVYEFTQQDTNSYYSPIQRFEGDMTNGRGYAVKLGFKQTMMLNP